MIMLKVLKEYSISKGRLNFDFILGNYILAEKRLASLQKHLTKDSNLLFEYHKTMNDNIIVGFIEMKMSSQKQFIIFHKEPK